MSVHSYVVYYNSVIILETRQVSAATALTCQKTVRNEESTKIYIHWTDNIIWHFYKQGIMNITYKGENKLVSAVCNYTARTNLIFRLNTVEGQNWVTYFLFNCIYPKGTFKYCISNKWGNWNYLSPSTSLGCRVTSALSAQALTPLPPIICWRNTWTEGELLHDENMIFIITRNIFWDVGAVFKEMGNNTPWPAPFHPKLSN